MDSTLDELAKIYPTLTVTELNYLDTTARDFQASHEIIAWLWPGAQAAREDL